MGWTSYRANFYKNGTVDRKMEMDTYFKDEDSANGECHFRTLKSAMVGSTYYAAIERTDHKTQGKEVFALVCLTSVNMDDYCNFSYKDMDETMGPYQYKCPIGILNLLTPTDNEYALRWREECRKYHEKKNLLERLDKHGKRGGKIGFTPAYDLSSGHKAGEEFVLHWFEIIIPYAKKTRGFWTDGVYRYPKSLLSKGEVRIIKKEA